MRFVTYNDKKIEYILTRKNVKNINLRVHSDGSVYVSANHYVPEAEIERFIISNADRIIKIRERFAETSFSASALKNEDKVFLLGREYTLKILKSNDIHYEFSDGAVILYVKNPFEYKQRKTAFNLLRRDLAEKVFKDIINDCYKDFCNACKNVPQLRIREMKTQWGNCRCSQNIITLNLRLISYDKDAIKFVVMHEYCHFVHPNHSRNFYALLSEVMPEWKKYDELLKNKSNYC